MRVFVSADHSAVGRVREIHAKLRAQGLSPVSRWVKRDVEPDMKTMSADDRLGYLRERDEDMADADVLFVLVGEGSLQAAADARHALSHWSGDPVRPVVWVGRRTLDAYRPGVTFVETVEAGLHALVRMAAVGRAA